MPLHQQEQPNDRQRNERRTNHDRPVVDLDKLRIERCHTDRERVVRVTAKNDQRPEETVPDVDERENSQSAQAGRTRGTTIT